jgi:hypothetical protein
LEKLAKPATASLDTSEEMLRMMGLPALGAATGGPTPEFLAGRRERG